MPKPAAKTLCHTFEDYYATIPIRTALNDLIEGAAEPGDADIPDFPKFRTLVLEAKSPRQLIASLPDLPKFCDLSEETRDSVSGVEYAFEDLQSYIRDIPLPLSEIPDKRLEIYTVIEALLNGFTTVLQNPLKALPGVY